MAGRRSPTSHGHAAAPLIDYLTVLAGIGYSGAYDSVQRFVQRWKLSHIGPADASLVPLVFAAGRRLPVRLEPRACRARWCLADIKVAHFRLAFSRQMFVVAYPRETQEMVLDAHNRAFAFFGGVPAAWSTTISRPSSTRFSPAKNGCSTAAHVTLANHYLFEPVACTPGSGWEKGQVENQVGNIREWLFTPLARFACFADLNDWLAIRCRELAARKHPTPSQRSIAACFADEQPFLTSHHSPL